MATARSGFPVIEPSSGEGAAPDPDATSPALRYLFGLDAEKLRLDVRTMALDAHEPLWSMGDDTPLTGRGRVTRPVADHLRQAFAQVTNPPIDPERERAVMDLQMELGRRPALLGGMPAGAATVRVGRPVVVDLEGLLDAVRVRSRAPHRAVRMLDATWPAAAGKEGLEDALDRLGAEALEASRDGAEVVVLTDAAADLDEGRLPVPSVLASGAVHTALAEAGLRGRTDLALDAGDVLDVHGLAMVVAAGARVVHPRLLFELVREQAGSRGAEQVTREAAIANVLTALDAGLRKVLARMGISTVASYVGGQLFETLELGPDLVARCFPAAAAWPGRLEAADLASVQLQRLEAARALAAAARPDRLPDPGFARFRGDGEFHLYSPSNASALETLAATGAADPTADVDAALATYRAALHREGALVRDGFRVRRPRSASPVPLDEVEDARSIARRFVVSAMSVGALSPEAHRVLTLGIQALGGAANTGEGGEDPAWYAPGEDGRATDSKIKQVASARFGVTAEYLARADQLEIKMAQGSKPGEGGQLPGRKVTAYIASLRRAQPGQALISPPPHHDIYSIEDLAQLIADLRAINPTARIGVKLVATRGVGTIASGVTKAGADYIHLSGHAGGTGASPLSSIKHVGAPWELGLSEVHQSLLRNDLRNRVALRTDGGLQTGDDLLIAALLGAEEFAFGTGALVAVGCDMARQCHLDTCPTGIATQREDLRAKFTGTPEMVVAFFLRIAEDLRRSLAAVGARSVGEVVGEGRRYLREAPGQHDRPVRPALPGMDGRRRAARNPVGRVPRHRAPGRLGPRVPPRRGVRRAGGRPLGHRPAGHDRRAVVRRGAHGRDPARRRQGAGEARARRCRRSELRRLGGRGRLARARGHGQRLRRQGPVRRPPRRPAGTRDGRRRRPGIGRTGVVRARGQHLPLRRHGRPAPRRRAGGHAVRDPQLRRRGGRRGARPARLRVHDRRHRRGAGPGRAELRRRDDRWARLPLGSVGAPRRGAPRRVRPGRPTRRGRSDPGRRPRAHRGPGPAPRRAPGRRLGARDTAARVGQRGVRRRLARGAGARRARDRRDAGGGPRDDDGLVDRGGRPATEPQPGRRLSGVVGHRPAAG